MKVYHNPPAWYVSGLAFACQHCGRCCAGPEEGYVWVTPEEIPAIAAHLKMDEETFRKKYVRRVGRRFTIVEVKGTNDCIFLSPPADIGGTMTRGCTIYSVRPRQCRTWPFWTSNLRDPDSWAWAGSRCRGINRGKRFSVEEIEARANESS